MGTPSNHSRIHPTFPSSIFLSAMRISFFIYDYGRPYLSATTRRLSTDVIPGA